jgi:hypothetical protein
VGEALVHHWRRYSRFDPREQDMNDPTKESAASSIPVEGPPASRSRLSCESFAIGSSPPGISRVATPSTT